MCNSCPVALFSRNVQLVLSYSFLRVIFISCRVATFSDTSCTFLREMCNSTHFFEKQGTHVVFPLYSINVQLVSNLASRNVQLVLSYSFSSCTFFQVTCSSAQVAPFFEKRGTCVVFAFVFDKRATRVKLHLSSRNVQLVLSYSFIQATFMLCRVATFSNMSWTFLRHGLHLSSRNVQLDTSCTFLRETRNSCRFCTYLR
jgi:hypothetical protein